MIAANDVYTEYGVERFNQKFRILHGLQNISLNVVDKDETFYWNNEPESTIEVRDDEIKLDVNIFKMTGKILSGCLERYFYDKNFRREIAVKPVIDLYEKLLFNAILSINKNREVPLVKQSFWPYGKEFAVCLTHDVDEIRKTYQYLTYSIRHIKKGNLKGVKNQLVSLVDNIRGNEPFWTFEEIMELEEELGVRSTFFFLNEDAKVNLLDPKTWRHYGRRFDLKSPKVMDVIKKLHSGGWEVALHGSFNSFKKLDKLQKEKEILERVLQGEICGTRQHNLNLSIPETWRYHEEIGLSYDSTLGFNDCVGFRWGTGFPFHPLDAEIGKTMKLLEIPLVLEDIAIYSYDNPWKEFIRVANEVERYGGILTVLWHHAVFNDTDFPGWSEMYRKIIEYCKNKGAWVTTACEIARWWEFREKTMVDVKFNDSELIIRTQSKNQYIDVFAPVEVVSNAKIVNVTREKTTISIPDGGRAVLRVEGIS